VSDGFATSMTCIGKWLVHPALCGLVIACGCPVGCGSGWSAPGSTPWAGAATLGGEAVQFVHRFVDVDLPWPFGGVVDPPREGDPKDGDAGLGVSSAASEVGARPV